MEGLIDSLVPIVGIVGVFWMPVFIVWTALHFNNKKKQQFHASLQKLIESGQELSPELLQSIPGYREEDKKISDIKETISPKLKKVATSTISWASWAVKKTSKLIWIVSTTGMITLFPYFLASRREYELMQMEMEMQQHMHNKQQQQAQQQQVQTPGSPLSSLMNDQPPADSGIPNL